MALVPHGGCILTSLAIDFSIYTKEEEDHVRLNREKTHDSQSNNTVSTMKLRGIDITMNGLID